MEQGHIWQIRDFLFTNTFFLRKERQTNRKNLSILFSTSEQVYMQKFSKFWTISNLDQINFIIHQKNTMWTIKTKLQF